MKYIKQIKIDLNTYINKNFFNKNIIIKYLNISNTWFETDTSNHFINIHSDIKIINNNNFNQIKNFLDTSNPEEYPNIMNYNFYYDYIATEFVNFIKQNKSLKINLNDYILKSSGESYKYLLHNQKTLSAARKEELKKVIFTNINYKCKYAAHILMDRLPQYEKELLKLDLDNDNVNIYLNNVLIYLINANHYLKDKIHDFEKFYRESELYRKLVNYRIQNNRFGSLKISYRSDILDDLALKNVHILEYYLEIAYLNSGEPIKNIHEELLRFVEKINKNPEAIFIYYGNTKRRILMRPENSEIRQTLMTDPVSFTRYIISDGYSFSYDEIEKYFPGYQKVISKIDNLHLIKDFFNFIQYKFFKNNNNPNFKNHSQTFKQLREYIYNNYSELIEKTSVSGLYSYYFARIIGAPFKEGEPAIFKEKGNRGSYLRFLKDDLGPDLVPDYDHYDFSELDIEEDEDDIGY